MSKIDSSSLPFLIVVAGPIVLGCALYLFGHLDSFSNACPRGGDLALIALDVEKASRLEALTGPYSRFGFRHPGPALAYFHAFFGELLPSTLTLYGKILIAQVLLNTLLLSVGALLLLRVTNSLAATMAGVFITWVMLPYADYGLFHSPWGPATLVLPMLVVILALSLVATGRFWPLLMASPLSVLIVQTHLSATLVLAAIGLIGLGLGVQRRLTSNQGLTRLDWFSLIGAPLIGIIMFAPPLIDAASASGGNLSNLVAWISHHPGEHSLLEASRYVAAYYWLPVRPLPIWARIVALVILLALAIRFRDRSSKELSALGVLIVVGVIASIVSAMRVTGELHRFLMWFQFAFTILFYLLVILALANLVKPYLLRFLNVGDTTIALAVVLLFVGYETIWKNDYDRKIRECSASKVEQVVKTLTRPNGTYYELHLPDPAHWKTASLVALGMYQRRIQFCVDRSIGYFFGPRLVCKPSRPTGRGHARIKICDKERIPNLTYPVEDVFELKNAVVVRETI